MAASRNKSLIGLVFFAVATAVHFIFGVHALVRVIGLACALTGIYWVFVPRIPIGWEGQEPSFHLTGWLAVTEALLLFGIGCTLLFFAPAAACMLGWSESLAC
jgi:hypothetical protein